MKGKNNGKNVVSRNNTRRILVDHDWLNRQPDKEEWKRVLSSSYDNQHLTEVNSQKIADVVLSGDPAFVINYFSSQGDKAGYTAVLVPSSGRRSLPTIQATNPKVIAGLATPENLENVANYLVGKSHALINFPTVSGKSGDSVLSVTAHLLRQNLMRVKVNHEDTDSLKTAKQQLEQIVIGAKIERSRVIPLGRGEYTEGGVRHIMDEAMVIKEIRAEHDATAMQIANYRYTRLDGNRKARQLRPPTVYSPIEILYGGKPRVFLVLNQIDGPLFSDVLVLLGEGLNDKNKNNNHKHYREIGRSLIQWHVKNLIYWVTKEEGLPIDDEELKQKYLSRAKMDFETLSKLGLVKDTAEAQLWASAFDVLFSRLKFPKGAIVARRDAVLTNSILRIEEWSENPTLETLEEALISHDKRDKLYIVPERIFDRCHGIDYHHSRAFLGEEFAKIRTNLEISKIPDFRKYTDFRLEQALAEISRARKFNPVLVAARFPKQLFNGYRAIRKYLFSIVNYPACAKEEYQQWGSKGYGEIKTEEALKARLGKFDNDAQYCLEAGERAFLLIGHRLSDSGMQGRTSVMSSINDRINKHLSGGLSFDRTDYDRDGNLLLCSPNTQKFHDVLERLKSTSYKNAEAFAAFLVAGFLYRHYSEVYKTNGKS